MATETKRIIEVDTGDSVQSIKDLKSEITELKKQLDNCVVGSEDAAKASQDLAQAQAKLTAATKGAITSNGELNNSYNGLVAQMAKLKAEWKATTDAATRADLSKQIDGLNDKLKDMDASVGVYSRNVGNYQSAFEALGNKGAGALIGGLKGIKGGFDMLKSHPLIAIAAVAITFFMKLVDRMKKNEEAMKSLSKAMYPIKAVADVIMSAFDTMAKTVADALNWLIEQAEKLVSWLGISFGRVTTKMMQTEKEIAETESSLAENHRKYLLENAQLELDASELKAKVADKEKYTNKERLAFMEEYNEKRKQIAANELAEAQEELKLLELQASTGVNSKEDNDKLAEAKAKVLQVQKAYNDTLRETNAQMSQLKKSIKDEADAKAKEKAEAAKKAADEEAKIEKEKNDKIKKLTDDLNKWKSNQSEQGKLDALKAQYETELAILGENAEAKKLLEEKYEQEVAAIKKQYRDKEDAARKEADDKRLKEIEEKAQKEKDAYSNTIGELSDFSSGLDSKLAAIGDCMAALQTASIQLTQSIKQGEKGWQKYGMMATAALTAAAALTSSLAAEQDTTTEEGFEQNKKLQISSAVMNTLAGIIAAWTSSMALPAPASFIMGGIQTAATAALGAAQIANIQKQKFDSSSSSVSSANVSTQALTSITAPVQYTSDVQGASTETEVQDTRVYVVESDITGTQNKVSTAESESRF